MPRSKKPTRKTNPEDIPEYGEEGYNEEDFEEATENSNFSLNCTHGHEFQCQTGLEDQCACSCGGHNHGSLLKDRKRPVANPLPGGEGRIVGAYPSRAVYIDGKFLSPKRSQKKNNHSPDGFNWGYHGSGCAQLALAICMELLPPEDYFVCQDFKREVIAELEQGKPFSLDLQETRATLYKLIAKAKQQPLL